MKINFSTKKAKNKILLTALLCFTLCSYAQQSGIELKGVVKDGTNYTVPYASISFTNKPKGTVSNEDGLFSLVIENHEVNDTLIVNSMGYEPLKFKIQDYINKKENVILLQESIVELSEIKLLSPADYVKNALKNLKDNTISSSHELTLLYRRASSEEKKARFFVEHYMKIRDRGPSAIGIEAIEILHSRKSADYRFFKKKEFRHSVIPMTIRNPVRQHMPIKKITWKKTGDSSYGDEDVVIIEGKPKGQASFKLFIGIDTYSIYRIENRANNSLYVYKRNNSGKLHLSYHSRQWTSQEKIPLAMQKQLRKSINQIQATYKHEVFVLNVVTNKKKIKVNHQEKAAKTDMALLKVDYNASFWNNFIAPPDTKYFKKIKKEIESNFGVPLEKQFEIVN
ncbi:hypothetical protein GCM10022291_31930 [Postechiella marina]|uniref:Carboxypeptidase-like regulatory domain-containing protein n=1 Tax=Postechiella marina TaxID=943941 RepID=A0ABP8CGL6_9FLAO